MVEGGVSMEFQDKILKCIDCGADFIFTAGEQLFPGREDEVGPAVDALQYFVLEFHGDAPFNHPYSMHSANERQPTLVTRARAQSSPTSSVALLKIDPGFGRPYWQKYGLLSHHQTRILMNRHANPYGRF